MQVAVSDTGGLGRRLEVTVPATEVSEEVKQRLGRLSRTARLKGFRPGKAPYAVVAKQFGEQVRAEVLSDLMRSSYAQALTQVNLKPAGGPRIEPLSMQSGADLRYAALIEVLPEVKVNSPEGLHIERPAAAVTEADIDAMIENMRRQRPVFTAVERPAGDSDRVVVDYQARINGKAFEGSDATDISVILGARQAMPELEEGLKGATAGEQRTIQAAFPAAHPNKALAGKSAELLLSIKRVEEQSLPPVDEEFCRAYGVEDGSLAQMRAEVRKSMERELAELIRGRLRAQVLDALYKVNPLELPRSMVDEETQQLQLQAARRMGVREASQLPPREPFEEAARRRVALGLLMGQVVQANGLKSDPARVAARLDDLVASYPNPEEARRAYQQSPEAMRQIESAALEDQVVEWVLERAHIAERPMSFSEVTGFGRDAREHEHTHEHEHEQASGT
ncbi:MAG: trigger factor [Steroidobacteraceae bacterium]